MYIIGYNIWQYESFLFFKFFLFKCFLFFVKIVLPSFMLQMELNQTFLTVLFSLKSCVMNSKNAH